MSRQYFMDTLADPPLVDSGAITSTGETALWTALLYTPIFAFDARPGKIYHVKSGGLLTMNTSVATITITPRIGTTVANGTTLGASLAMATNSAFASKPWFLEFCLVVRSVGGPGSNSGVYGIGQFQCIGTTAAASQVINATMGGSIATADLSINQAINMGVALSTGTMTVGFAFIQSTN